MNEQTLAVLRRLEEEDRRDREDGTPQELAPSRQAAESYPEPECLLVPIPRGELLCRKTMEG